MDWSGNIHRSLRRQEWVGANLPDFWPGVYLATAEPVEGKARQGWSYPPRGRSMCTVSNDRLPVRAGRLGYIARMHGVGDDGDDRKSYSSLCQNKDANSSANASRSHYTSVYYTLRSQSGRVAGVGARFYTDRPNVDMDLGSKAGSQQIGRRWIRKLLAWAQVRPDGRECYSYLGPLPSA